MGSILYSNCSTITTGCYIYNDIYKTSPVGNGYYSDGTNCYDVQWGNGYVNAVTSCAVDVYFTAGGDTNFDGAGDYSYVLFSDTTSNSWGGSPINLTTAVTVYTTIYAEYNTYYASGAIGSGFSCAAQFYADGTYPNQFIFSLTLTSLSPSSNGNQTYYTSGGSVGTYSC